MFDATGTFSPFGNGPILQELPEQVKSISEEPDGDSRSLLRTEHLVEIQQRLVDRPDLVQEAMVAWTLVTCPWVDSTRGIARWSGCHKETVQNLAAPEGQVSSGGFLYTVTRGHASVNEEEREDMVLRFSSARGYVASVALGLVTAVSDQSVTQGYRSTSAQYSLNYSSFLPYGQDRTCPVLAVVGKDEGPEEGNGRKSTGIGESLMGGAESLALLDQKHPILRALDPSLDLWLDNNPTGYSLGRHAWRLAVLLGMRDTTLTLAELRELTGLEEQAVRRLLARWRKVPLLFLLEEKRGRTKTVTLNFASALLPDGDFYETCALDHTRRNERAMRDLDERTRSARRSTPSGLLAWRLCAANPHREVPELGPDADPQWAALVEQGDEVSLYDYLVSREQSAPASPAALEGSLPPAVVEVAPQVHRSAARPCEAPYSAPGVPVPDAVALAAMKKRIAAYSR